MAEHIRRFPLIAERYVIEHHSGWCRPDYSGMLGVDMSGQGIELGERGHTGGMMVVLRHVLCAILTGDSAVLDMHDAIGMP